MTSASKENTPPRSTFTILVEEERGIRRLWQNHFRSTQLTLIDYATPEGFLCEFPHLPRGKNFNYQFYLDQDFGQRRGLGVALAREIRRTLPKAWISLVTAYPSKLFEFELNTHLLDDVLPKFPQHIFGDLFGELLVQSILLEEHES